MVTPLGCRPTSVTAISGLLCGAISKSSGAKTATISNIPSILVWIGMFYLFGFTDI